MLLCSRKMVRKNTWPCQIYVEWKNTKATKFWGITITDKNVPIKLNELI